MRRRHSQEQYTSTNILTNSEKYTKYTFWLLLLIFLIFVFLCIYCYSKGGIPVKVKV